MKNRELLEILLAEFHDKFKLVDKLNRRDAMFPKADNKIKVAMGIRSGGKTYFCYQKVLSLLEE